MQTQAYFDDIQVQIIRELKKARYSIRIAIAWFTDGIIFDTLCDLSSAGIKVEIILMDDHINRQSGLQYNKLGNLGGKIYFLGDKKRNSTVMHNKFCIIDGDTIITGSYNWSKKAKKNDENIIVVKEDSSLVKQFLLEFETIKERNFQKGVSINYGKIFSHLEAIKRFVQEGDDDDVEHSLNKLKKIVPNEGADFDEIRNIMDFVKTDDPQQVAKKIDDFLLRNSQIVHYVDPEVAELRLELKSLSIQISAMSDEKAEIERVLNAYNFQFNINIGSIMREILELRRERLRKEAETNQSKQFKYEEANKDYEDFEKAAEDAKSHPSFELTDEEQKELRATFRAASMICHPDKVAENDKAHATEMFCSLREAFEQNDLAKVSEIYANVKKGVFTALSESLKEVHKLHAEIVMHRIKATDIAKLIHELRNSEVYMKISAISDWDKHFADLRAQLEMELQGLREEQ